MSAPAGASPYPNHFVSPGGEPSSTDATDQVNALRMPSDTRVSIDVAPCRRLRQAARWNGHAHHPTTGSEQTTSTHSQPGNRICGDRASTIAKSPSGTVSSAATSSRSHSIRTRSPCPPDSPSTTGDAPYPAASTTPTASAAFSGGSPRTMARSVA